MYEGKREERKEQLVNAHEGKKEERKKTARKCM